MTTFTPRTARAALVALRPVAERSSRVARIMAGMRPKHRLSDARVDPEYFGLLTALLGALETLRSAGVRIQDPAAGLLDFPARRAGRAVFLCWRIGEPSLGHWHEVDAGFAGRRPVDEDGPWEDDGGPVR